MASSIVPTRVSHSRSRTPLRDVTRFSVRSYRRGTNRLGDLGVHQLLGEQSKSIPKKLRIRSARPCEADPRVPF